MMKRYSISDCRITRWVLAGAVLFSCMSVVALAQFGRGFGFMEFNEPPEDAEFVFARVRYNSSGRRMFGGSGWAHDYPDAEEHILQVANEATMIHTQKMAYVVVDLESEEIFKFPFLYFSEVGEMNMTEREIANFREYFNRGGFAMIDDFDGQETLAWFLSQMKQVFPEREFTRMAIEHPLYHTYYDIPTLELESPYNYSDGPPVFYGYFDEKGRLMMIINHNNDVGDFWEWIDQPRFPLQPSTEALRLGINYFIYSMTH